MIYIQEKVFYWLEYQPIHIPKKFSLVLDERNNSLTYNTHENSNSFGGFMEISNCHNGNDIVEYIERNIDNLCIVIGFDSNPTKKVFNERK